MERKRQHLETRDMEERKRKREAEIEQEEQRTFEKEWAKNFEVKYLASGKLILNSVPIFNPFFYRHHHHQSEEFHC